MDQHNNPLWDSRDNGLRKYRRNVEMAGCKCAKLDPEEGRYKCSVSGDGCMYMSPDSKRCAKDYDEGPDADNDEE